MRGNQTGAAFQELVNRINEAYERAGRACITRKGIPGKYIADRQTRRGLSVNLTSNTQSRLSSADLRGMVKTEGTNWRKFVPESKAEPDYGGTIAPNGRSIYYDAKTTRRDVLDFDNLHAHQIEYLERAARVGAVAGFLVEFNAHRTIFFLPVQVVAGWRDRAKRKSIPYSFFTANLRTVPQGKSGVIYDYLGVIEAQEQDLRNTLAAI